MKSRDRLATDSRPGLAGAVVVLDCRWLGLGGAGRLTEALLRELRVAGPPGRWILWGDPERLRGGTFPGSSIARAEHDPRLLLGQRDAAALPRGDIAIYLHQVRPLRPGRSITFILDTIPLRHGGSRPSRALKHLYLGAVARLSTHVITISEYSKQCIQNDLRVDARRISIARPPVDEERAARVADLRRVVPQRDVLLYVGRFGRHKNLSRLCLAFAASEFASGGGKLLLVGALQGERAGIERWIARSRLSGIEVRSACPEEELDRLLASSRALVAPSLEEGYGLPAFEAVASGLPVAVSRTGAMTELPSDRAVMFDPKRLDDITAAIDDATCRPTTPWRKLPRLAAFSGVVLAVLERSLRARRSH